MIRVEGLTKVYENGTRALQGVDLEVAPGELLYIMGASGAGKTTFLKLILGMERPTGGDLQVDGVSLLKPAPRVLRRLRRSMGAVFQDFRLILGRTALDNVALSLRVQGVSWPEIRDRSRLSLETVGLAEKMDVLVEVLSWGERQRVALARALVRTPRLLLADEPTGNLDAESVGFVVEALKRGLQQGATILVVTHDMRLVRRLPGRIVVLRQGRCSEVPAEWDPEMAGAGEEGV